jgi:elongation factor Ts
MAAITAGQVKDLREKTGVGMMECKKALEENGGDFEKAVLWLRERGMSRAAKKADRVAAEGVVEVYVSPDMKAGVLVELNCETDFVAKNAEFTGVAKEAAQLALKTKAKSVDELLGAKLQSGQTVKERLTELIAKIGENMTLRRVQVLAADGIVAGYSHMGGKIGTLVAMSGATTAEADKVKDIAMHVAASAPRYLVDSEVSKTELETERELAKKKLLEEGKPAEMVEKILVGQMKKFFKEVCLAEQPFVKDPALTVTKYADSIKAGAKVQGFAYFKLGEGIEKKKEDFAAEVASMMK